MDIKLPEPDVSYEAARDDSDLRYAYSVEAMQDYAHQAALAERERCATVAETVRITTYMTESFIRQVACAREIIAAAIRKGD